jgi:hypothetical protein
VQWGYDQNYSDLGQNIENLVFSNIDAYVVVNPDDTTDWEYVCEGFQCPYNGSLTQISNFNIATQPAGTEIAWTDLAGYMDPSCMATGPNCAPYVRINWPKRASAAYHRNRQYPGDHPRDPAHYYEFDQSPGQLGTGSEFWLVPTDHEPRP